MVNNSLNKKVITENKNSFLGESKDDENLEEKIPLIGRIFRDARYLSGNGSAHEY